jgi:hypothetical protein
MTRKHTRAASFHCPLALVITWIVIGAPCLQAQKSGPTENEVKSAYLYNFGKFVEWPAKATSVGDFFTICILGDDTFGSTLETTIAGESINGRKISVKRVTKLPDAVDCRILFISSSQQNRLKEILAELGNASVLTVSDMPEFTRRGGMIQFVVEGNRVRFEVNITATQHPGLTLSSELLKVATTVRRISPPGD